MNSNNRGPVNKNIHTTLNDFLDFGPETVVLPTNQPESEIAARIKALVLKLQEINERLDKISQFM